MTGKQSSLQVDVSPSIITWVVFDLASATSYFSRHTPEHHHDVSNFLLLEEFKSIPNKKETSSCLLVHPLFGQLELAREGVPKFGS